MYNYYFIILIGLTSCFCLQAQQKCILNITAPSCESLKNPMGIEMAAPRFSWQLNSDCQNQKQSAYHILVASSKQKVEQNEGDLWDSKKVMSSKSLHITYGGKILKSAQTYYWKIKVWNSKNIVSEWSSTQQWTMGLMNKAEKTGKWIGLNIPVDSATEEQKNAAHYFFSEFSTNKDKTLSQATAYVSGLGLFDFYINGKQISDNKLNPANSSYHKRAVYVAFDLSNHLNSGGNAAGIVLGNGKHLTQRRHITQYGLPRMWCQIHLKYRDGSTQIIKSDSSWRFTVKGPVRFNNEYDGEHYDARMEIEHWATIGMDTSGWKKVDILKEYKPELSPQLMPPVRVVDILTAKTISQTDSGKYILDFGQNVTGWGRLKTEGKSGTEIRLRFAELTDSTGNLDSTSIRSAKATDVYILKGKGIEIFEPRFTYHGFRYVEITGLDKVPDTSVLKACVAHNDLGEVGSFVCSNPLLNKIYSNARWSIRGNYQHVPVDCPQRDERFGWLGDRSATIFGELYLYDIHHFYSKWMQDIEDGQLESGALPNLAPAHWKVYRDNVTWPATYIQLAGMLYKYYGDSILVAKHYDSMQKWVDYIALNYSSENGIYSDQYGDWLAPPEKVSQKSNKDARLKSSSEILATTTYLMVLSDMAKFASLLQKNEDALLYKKRADTLKSVLYGKLLDKSIHSYGNHSPTEILLMLAQNDLPTTERTLLQNNLLGMLRGQYDGKMAFGLVGMRWPMKVLSESGNINFAYQLATNRAYPGWGYMIDRGATTMWEVWTGKQKKSQNHVMLTGDLLQWFYGILGGIQPADDGIAFNKIKLLPYLPDDLDSVKVTFQSPKGEIISHWKKNNGKFRWHVEIPAGTTSEIYLPCNKRKSIKKQQNFLRFDTLPGQRIYAVFQFGSGKYDFECRVPEVRKNAEFSTPPKINMQDSIISTKEGEKYMIELSSSDSNAIIYYTSDGSDPDIKSEIYSKPFEIKDHTMIKAISKEKGKSISFVKNSFVDIYNPTINGWNYWYYEKSLRQLPDYNTLTAVDSGRVSKIDLKKLKKRKNFWAFRFESYLDIPTEGEYTFYLASDDGARLLIGEKEVVSNDGIHYKTQRRGSIRLTKGRHFIRMEHFNSWSYNGLEVLISGPEVPKQRLPVSWLHFDKQIKTH